MARLVFGLSQSLDGYVDHMKLGPPAPEAFGHFVELMRGMSGYEIMSYWEEGGGAPFFVGLIGATDMHRSPLQQTLTC